MQYGKYTQSCRWIPSLSMCLPMFPGLLLICSLGGCAAGLQQPTGTPQNRHAGESYEARLKAVEASMQQLTQRLDSMQLSTASSQTVSSANLRPVEYRPIKPAIVLASSPARSAPVVPHAPARVPVSVPKAEPQEVPVSPQRRHREGNWVINLASYKSSAYASRKQVEFTGKGVAVEQVRADVKGKTFYRLYVPGFDSSRAANTEATAIRVKLGLSNTWIARR